MKATFIFLFLVLLFSCQSSEEKQLEKVLTLAGNNRPELEKVLEHYKENEADSLKLRAAKFLIMNMPGHQSYIGKDIEEYYVEAEKIIFSDRKIDEQVNELNNLLLEFPSDDFEFKEDYSVIKAFHEDFAGTETYLNTKVLILLVRLSPKLFMFASDMRCL